MKEKKASPGRIVHFTDPDVRGGSYCEEPLAAIVTGVGLDGHVSLHVFFRSGQCDLPSVPFTEAPAGSEAARGHWAWPAQTP